MPIKSGRIRYYKVKKIITHFCVDIDAQHTAVLVGVNRKTVNRYYFLFRYAIYEKQMHDFKKFFGIVELDEAYFVSNRLRGKICHRKEVEGHGRGLCLGYLKEQEKYIQKLFLIVKEIH